MKNRSRFGYGKGQAGNQIVGSPIVSLYEIVPANIRASGLVII